MRYINFLKYWYCRYWLWRNIDMYCQLWNYTPLNEQITDCAVCTTIILCYYCYHRLHSYVATHNYTLLTVNLPLHIYRIMTKTKLIVASSLIVQGIPVKCQGSSQVLTSRQHSIQEIINNARFPDTIYLSP